MRRHLSVVLLALLAAVGVALVATAAHAQGVTGTVSGTVKDSQGGVVPGATVTLISESRGTVSTPVVTNATGDFVIPNNVADTYTVQVDMPQFRTLKRPGVQVSAGSYVALGALTLQIGATTDVVTVKGEAPLVQAASSERSYTVSTESMASLPLALRSYESLLTLAPGVDASPGDLNPAARLGGGGGTNYMVDGSTAVDPALNRPASKVSVEAISEVKVVTSGYQAEYARASGLQINAVTKSGTNLFHGSFYDVERNSKWNANSQTNILNGDPKAFQDERDWGMTAGGPVGKPGGSNKLFFFFNVEFNPRTFGNQVTRYRMPTLLERQGDFSQSTDNLGRPFPYIRNPALTGACNAASQVACFNDGGVLGRIPASQLYQPGINILKWWPEPNIQNVPAGQAYNFEVTDPEIPLLGYQPLVRVDFQPTSSLRATFKYLTYLQANDPIPGTLGEFNATIQDNFGIYVPSASMNWTINSSTFVEVNWGANWHHQEGCNIAGGSPNFCRNGLPVSPLANRNVAGFGAIPSLFPNALQLETDTWSYHILQRNADRTSVVEGTKVLSPPAFSWGSRIANAPPNNNSPFNDFLLNTETNGVNGSLTKVTGGHTFKVGYYYFRSIQSRTVGNFTGSISFAHDDNVPSMSTFGFANAALGIFNQYDQSSRLPEGAHLGVNHEFFVQDTWKVGPKLTVDYGLRFVHQIPAWDTYQRSSNFLPEKWDPSQAPLLYLPACVSTSPCSGNDRQAMDPVTKKLLGPGSALAIATLVPNTGNLLNGLFVNGQGITPKLHTFPALGVAPRFGAAWDVSGNQRFVVRGSAGLFFDREGVNTGRQMITNPPFTQNVTLRYGRLQDLGAGGSGLVINAPPALVAMQYDMPLPATVEWSTGVQVVAPFATVLDVAYAGHHLYNELANGVVKNVNWIDIGTGFLLENQDPTRAGTSTVPAATSNAALQPDLSRYFKGYGTIGQRFGYGTRTYHGLQITLTRRMTSNLAFGFTDSIGLYDHSNTTYRVQHNPDGTITARDDQAKADELLGDNAPRLHTMRANFTWLLPGMRTDRGNALDIVGHIVRDWSLSSIWSGTSGSPYSVNFTYGSGGSAVNLTGSPNYAARVVIANGADPGSGCSSDPLRQFNTSAFNGPPVGSVGLDSGANYMRGCFVSAIDFALARTIRLGGSKSVQLRADFFNTFNQAAITSRAGSAQFASPANPTAIQNLPFDASGNVIPSLSLPRGAGFGVATAYQDPRTIQLQVRFSF